jgi:hypothetical protein
LASTIMTLHVVWWVDFQSHIFGLPDEIEIVLGNPTSLYVKH